MEISNLQRLDKLILKNNKFSGQIPESICELDINWHNNSNFYVSYNNLCPPYPACVIDYIEVSNQDSTNCN